MRGILCDNDVEGQFRILHGILLSEAWLEFWESLQAQVYFLPDLGLRRDASDLTLWQECQTRQLVLITGNRSAEGVQSLENTIRALNKPACLPVLTLANAQRIHRDKPYAERVPIRLLDYLLSVDDYRGVGRMFVP